jgi:predicted phage-related endonuclease
MLTPEQLKKRVGRITSSTAAACLGLDPRKSQIEAWCQIKGEDPAPEPEKEDPKFQKLLKKAIERGNRLEDYILEYGAEWLSHELDRPIRMEPAPFQSIDDWTGDSSDALYYDGSKLIAPGEGKSASLWVGKEYGEEGTDEIPHHTLLQSHWHLIHWPEAEFCLVPVLIGGMRFEFRCYQVDRDPEFEKIILEDLKAWHEEYIVGDKCPPARCSDESWLHRRYPKGLKGIMPDTPKMKQLAFQKWRAAIEKKAWADRECDAKAAIKEELAEFEQVNGFWGKVTWLENAPSLKIGWQELTEVLFEKLGMADADRTTLIGDHTNWKPGPRVLRVSVKKEYREDAMQEEENGSN